MLHPPVVKVVNPRSDCGWMWINAADFDPEVHAMYDELAAASTPVGSPEPRTRSASPVSDAAAGLPAPEPASPPPSVEPALHRRPGRRGRA